ncbi:hypothetical protein ES703_91514 [subsurface metagenome]
MVEASRAFVNDRVARYQSTALPRGNHFVDLKTINAHVTKGPQYLSAIRAADALRAILQDRHPAFTGGLHYRVHITGPAEQVDGNDGLGSGSDFSFEVFGIEIKGAIDVGKDRQSPRVDYTGIVRPPGVSRYNHLIARPNTETCRCAIQSCRARGHAQPKAGAHIFCKIFFEA